LIGRRKLVRTGVIFQGFFRLFHVFVGQPSKEVRLYAVRLDSKYDVKEEHSLVELLKTDVTAG
jgi:hypothetical protein